MAKKSVNPNPTQSSPAPPSERELQVENTREEPSGNTEAQDHSSITMPWIGIPLGSKQSIPWLSTQLAA